MAQITLDEELNITCVGDLKTNLIQTLSADSAIELNAANVERVDTAALQLLTAFVQHANASDKKINWVNPSDKFLKSVELLGLKGSLGIA